jgi:hypothetical protein
MKLRLALFIAPLATLFSHRVSAQAPSLVLPIADVHAIAVDFDRGLSPLYCYFGVRVEQPTVVVRVDSVIVVTSPSDCVGIGFAFVMRVTDRALLAQALRGVIESNPQFAVVSAFYRTEDIDDRGSSVRAARALSVVRGARSIVMQGGS